VTSVRAALSPTLRRRRRSAGGSAPASSPSAAKPARACIEIDTWCMK